MCECVLVNMIVCDCMCMSLCTCMCLSDVRVHVCVGVHVCSQACTSQWPNLGKKSTKSRGSTHFLNGGQVVMTCCSLLALTVTQLHATTLLDSHAECSGF